MPKREVYLLSPKKYSPETIAVAFAKTSRFPDAFRDIADDLNEETSARFHEKWVVGYGHASVAEHAVLHLAIENASRVAMEAIEGNRLASYTEKSTRYQKWEADDFTIPPELDTHPLKGNYLKTVQMLFRVYADSLEPVKTVIEKIVPRRPNESDEKWDRRVRSQYVDSCRFLLPAAANANVGMTANARVLENTVRKMLSHPLAEIRQIGDEIKLVAKNEVPTLVKYAEAMEYLVETGERFTRIARDTFPGGQSQGEGREKEKRPANSGLSAANDWCHLVGYDEDGENKVLTAALYRFSGMPYQAALECVKSATDAERTELADSLLGGLGRFDVPLRELEYCNYTFDLVMDQGAYAEFKRHRMMTQTPQLLTTRLGYAVPRLITEAGFESQYRSAMDAAGEMYEKLHEFDPNVAQYVVPNGYNRRVLAQFNLREAFHFSQLRAAMNAHYSIRRVAQCIYEKMATVHPLLTKYMRLPKETWQVIEEENFSGV